MHSYVGYCSDGLLPQLEGLSQRLSKGDQGRLREMKSEKRSLEFLFGRLIFEQVLNFENCQGALSEIEYTDKGKPLIKGKIAFSISHSKTCFAIAVSPSGSVGVDVQEPQTQRNILGAIKTFGNQKEKSLLLKLPKDQVFFEFYKSWTLKESYAKATGDGLTSDLNNFCFIEGHEVLPKGSLFYHCLTENFHVATCLLAPKGSCRQKRYYQIEFDGRSWQRKALDLKNTCFK